MEHYYSSRHLPAPSSISGRERFMRPAIYDTIAPSAVKAGFPPLRMGRPLEAALDGAQLPRLLRFFAHERYVLNARVGACMHSGRKFIHFMAIHHTTNMHVCRANPATRPPLWMCSSKKTPA